MHAYAIYPATRYLPLKVRSLIDFLIERFGEAPIGIVYNPDTVQLVGWSVGGLVGVMKNRFKKINVLPKIDS